MVIGISISLLLLSSLIAEVTQPVILTWTAVGDDGDVGYVSDFDVRYSTEEITEGNFYDCPSAAWEVDSIVYPNTLQIARVSLPVGTWVVAIKAGDEVQRQNLDITVDSIWADTVFLTYEGRNWSTISNLRVKISGVGPPIWETFK